MPWLVFLGDTAPMPDLVLANPTVKICGIRDLQTAEVAIRFGAGALGMMFAPSRRRVDPTEVRLIRDSLAEAKPHVSVVGVVVNETARTLDALVEQSGIDMIQLSGDESPQLLDQLQVPVIKAIRIKPGSGEEEARRVIDPWLEHRRPVAAILLDAYVDGHYGGTGLRSDWELAARLAERYPLMLAGGLTPENVAASVQQVLPFGVDVSSGVETAGVKDPTKIRRFLAASLAAFASVVPTGVSQG